MTVDGDVAAADAAAAAVVVVRSWHRPPPRWRLPTAVLAGSFQPFSSANSATAVIPPPQCGNGGRAAASNGIWHAPTADAGCTANNNTTTTPPRPFFLDHHRLTASRSCKSTNCRPQILSPAAATAVAQRQRWLAVLTQLNS